MHLLSCCFANLIQLLFAVLIAVAVVCCLSSLLLWSRNFATVVTWRHTSPLYLQAYWKTGSPVYIAIFTIITCIFGGRRSMVQNLPPCLEVIWPLVTNTVLVILNKIKINLKINLSCVKMIVASTYWYIPLTFMESLRKVGDNILMVIQELSDNTIVSLL